jgi:hypothetical protein
MNQNERPDTKALNEWLSAPGMGLMFSNEEAKNLVRPLVAWIDAQPSAPVAPEPDEAADECSDESSRDELRRQATIARKFAEALVAAACSASGSTEA